MPRALLILLASLLLARPSVAVESVPTTLELFHSVKETDFVTRLEKFSEKFLGTPYTSAPLGEGSGARFDQGPAFRFDAFDCTTYVETVTALALSREPKEFEGWLKKIRYWKGKVDYLNRNHFACGDWVPNNEGWGLFTDITKTLAGPKGTKVATAWEDKKGWVAHLPKEAIRVSGMTPAERDQRYAELQKQAAPFRPKKVELDFIPMDSLLVRKPIADDEKKRRTAEEDALVEKLWEKNSVEVGDNDSDAKMHKEVLDLRLKYLIKDVEVDPTFLASVPSGSLILVVRPNLKVPGTPLLISHLGFVIRKEGAPYFRHSSLSGGARTKDVPLANYLRLCLLSPAIHGIQVLKINDVRPAPPATVVRAKRKARPF